VILFAAFGSSSNHSATVQKTRSKSAQAWKNHQTEPRVRCLPINSPDSIIITNPVKESQLRVSYAILRHLALEPLPAVNLLSVRPLSCLQARPITKKPFQKA